MPVRRLFMNIALSCLVAFLGATRVAYAQHNAWAYDSLNADAFIISDQNTLNITGLVSDLMWMHYEREVTLVYRNQQAIESHGTFSLPESWDPAYDYRNVPLAERDEVHRPFLSDLKVKSFKGNVVNGKKEEPLKFRVTNSRDEELFMNRVFPKNAWHYELKNIQPGDTVKLKYVWEIPYNENWFRFNGKRIFMHGDLPKQEFQLLITHNSRLNNTFSNLAEDSVVYTDKRVTRHYWSGKQLPGCINEPGARPYLDLPHIEMQLNTDNLRYHYVDQFSGMVLRAPYWRYVLKWRQARALWLIRVAQKKWVLDRQNKKVDAFLKKTTAGIHRNNRLEKLLAVHQEVAEDFDWQNDYEYYAQRDRKLERMGDFTEKKIIRDVSRYNLYCKYISRLGLSYKTAYLLDKRMGSIDKEFMSPLWDADFTFAMPSNGQLIYLYPKKSRFGYEADEMPFYWEGSNVLVTDPHDLWLGDRALPDFVETPASDAQNNMRVTSGLVMAELGQNKLEFDTRVSLSGQFSTMTRGYYLHEVKDSSVTNDYYQRIDDLPGVSNRRQQLTSFIPQFPYKANFRFKYGQDSQLLTDSAIASIPLRGWFNCLGDEIPQAEGRALNWYPDFKYLDRFTYQIRFDRAVQLLDYSIVEDIENEFGSIHLSVRQESEWEIWVTLEVEQNADVVPGHEVQKVAQLLHALDHLDQKSIKVRILE